MKRLFLLRHAKALSIADSGKDFDRALSPQGASDAKALGNTMEARKLVPDLILCSPARRTHETLKHVMKAEDIPSARMIAGIYQANDFTDLTKIIQSAEDSAQTLLLIGHNPAIHEMAGNCAMSGSDALSETVSNEYPPGTLSIFECDVESWADFDPRKCSIVGVFMAHEYNAGPKLQPPEYKN